MSITMRAHAKINWTLDILGKRADGYHELDMLVETIALNDELRFEKSAELTLAVDGRPLPAGPKNLVLRAAMALNEYAHTSHGARIRLVKRIPICAGLGGGSADCACALLALNNLWGLGLSGEALARLAARLGADVPFCLKSGLARVTGLGEKIAYLRPVTPVPLVLIHPGRGLRTPEVFAQWDAGDGLPLGFDAGAAQAALERGDLRTLGAHSGNALEGPAMRLMPAIGHAKSLLLEAGAVFARMTGSGSAVFGAFDSVEAARAAKAKIGRQAILTSTCRA